jgi:hypothetical protein
MGRISAIQKLNPHFNHSACAPGFWPSGATLPPWRSACTPCRLGYVSFMTSLPCIGKTLLAAVVVLSLAVFQPALALINYHSPCCCQTYDGCEKNSTHSSCPCTTCAAGQLAHPLALIAEKKCPQPLFESSLRWDLCNERAAERRCAPPVPPPRITI